MSGAGALITTTAAAKLRPATSASAVSRITLVRMALRRYPGTRGFHKSRSALPHVGQHPALADLRGYRAPGAAEAGAKRVCQGHPALARWCP